MQKPSALLDTRVVYCGDNLEQLAKLPDACVDLIYIDPPFNSNRNYKLASPARTWGETKEKRAFEDRHENTKAYIDFFVSFDYSSDALSEIESFFKRSHKVIVALTVQEILDEHIAKKLA
jgi:DNA modification methylase